MSIRGHTLIGFAADAAPVVLDCGAHKGEFAEEAVRRWNARVYAIEGSPILHERITESERVSKHHFALADRDGCVAFGLAENPEASRVGAPKQGHESIVVPSRTLETFLDEQRIAHVDLLKLDIEGAEVPVLLAASGDLLKRIGQITVEFHDFCGLTPVAEVRRVLEHLSAHGFLIFKFSRKSHLDVLCINRDSLPLSSLDRLYLDPLMYYWMGMRRVLGRLAA